MATTKSQLPAPVEIDVQELKEHLQREIAYAKRLSKWHGTERLIARSLAIVIILKLLIEELNHERK